MTNEELAGVDELVGRLKGRVRQRLPIDWQKNRQCPECGTAADRPKCMWELGGNCPRHDPENYDPSPFIEEPDPDCYAAVTVLQSLITTAREAEALRAENARLQARADAARREALEEASKVARDYAGKAAQRGWVLKPGSIVTAARHIATTIRALKGNPNG